VAELLAEIAAASKEQSQGIAQVNTAMVDVDKVTQQNAATAEESTAAVIELTSQAEQMKRLVEDLQGLIGGHARDGRSSPTKTRPKSRTRQPIEAAAGRVPARAKRGGKQTPEETIPLDTEDFKDF
jgi:methyl-accepting chemotaxis protein